ncbi:MAG TPA: endonuclease/exonuclease/phosphatase family protein [Vicinamibacteria bacterium]
MPLRVATYNVHRCRGLDGRVRPDRIARVLEEVAADVVALQEVRGRAGDRPFVDQSLFLAEALGLELFFAPTRTLGGHPYGNALLTRLPAAHMAHHDLSVAGLEPRGCQHVDVTWERTPVHVFNVNLGTSYRERRQQGLRLVSDAILLSGRFAGPRLVLGDFNEWAPGLTTRLLRGHLRSVDVARHLKRRRTYPGVLPFLHLDHIYHDEALELTSLRLHRTRLALLASDHLPLVAEFEQAAKAR